VISSLAVAQLRLEAGRNADPARPCFARDV
jgi:hypothetical protein